METKIQQLANDYASRYITLAEQNIAREAFLAGIMAKAELKPPKKPIEERYNEFRAEILLYRNQYTDDMLRDFFEYWTERGTNDRKMRFEKQASWETSKRLARWANNNNKYGNRNYQNRNSNKSPSIFDIASKVADGNSQGHTDY